MRFPGESIPQIVLFRFHEVEKLVHFFAKAKWGPAAPEKKVPLNTV
jgi:hypothetical protein